MSKAGQMTLLMSLHREMTKTKRRNEEVTRKNENEILTLRKENEEMRRKLREGGSSLDRPILSAGPSPPHRPQNCWGAKGQSSHPGSQRWVLFEQVDPYDQYSRLNLPTSFYWCHQQFHNTGVQVWNVIRNQPTSPSYPIDLSTSPSYPIVLVEICQEKEKIPKIVHQQI